VASTHYDGCCLISLLMHSHIDYSSGFARAFNNIFPHLSDQERVKSSINEKRW
jgi:hypothetical protein